MTTRETERRTAGSVGAWTGLVLAAVVTATTVGVIDWFVMWGQSSTCGDAPDPAEVRAGRAWLGGMLLFSAAPWVLGATMSRRRVAVAAVGAFAVTPGALFVLHGASNAAWIGSFCF
jgi:hypothetical protein